MQEEAAICGLYGKRDELGFSVKMSIQSSGGEYFLLDLRFPSATNKHYVWA